MTLRRALASGILFFAFLLPGVVLSDTPTSVGIESVKAYRSLNFGDSKDVAMGKLALLLNGADIDSDEISQMPDMLDFWRPLFDTDAEFNSYHIDIQRTDYSAPFKALRQYFRKTVKVARIQGSNSAVSIDCYFIDSAPGNSSKSGLAIVNVSYNESQEPIVAAFVAAYPTAIKEIRKYSISSDKHPGISLQFSRVFYAASSADADYILSVPSRQFSFSFPDLASLSSDEKSSWSRLAATDGNGSSVDAYFLSVKSNLLEIQRSIEADPGSNPSNPLERLRYLGWYGHDQNQVLEYAPPALVARSKNIIHYHLDAFKASSLAAESAGEKAHASDVQGADKF